MECASSGTISSGDARLRRSSQSRQTFWRLLLLQEIQKVIDRNLCSTNKCAKRSLGKLFMLGNGKISAHTRLGHHEMAAELTGGLPACSGEGLHCFSA